MKMSVTSVVALSLALVLGGCSCDRTAGSGSADGTAWSGAVDFDHVATQALQVMKQRAEELKANGAGIVAYIPGDMTTTWSSRMVVVGSFTKNNNNVLGIVYAKASEMADTLQDSGSGVRAKLNGENGWKGGVIRKVPGGYLIAAFSGAKSEDDVAFSTAGMEIMLKAYGPQGGGK